MYHSMCLFSILINILAVNYLTATKNKGNGNVAIGRLGHCQGQMQTGQGYLRNITQSNNNYAKNVSGLALCAAECTANPWCLNALYNYSSSNCSQYSSGNFEPSTNFDGEHIIYWQCETQNPEVTKRPESCPGYWIKYFNVDPIGLEGNQYTNKSFDECQTLCYNHSLCAVAKYEYQGKMKFCILYMLSTNNNNTDLVQFPATLRKHVVIIVWTCKSIKHGINPSLPCHWSKAYNCSGQWTFSATNIFETNITSTEIVSVFATYRADDCYKECTMHPFCKRPFYSYAHHVCLLQSFNRAAFPNFISNIIMLSQYMYSTWTWNCCNSNKIFNLLNIIPFVEKEINPKNNAKCVCINQTIAYKSSETKIYMSPDACGEKLDIKIAVPEKAAYWAHLNNKNWPIIKNDENVVKVNNGQQDLWLSINDDCDALISLCDIEFCNIFSPTMQKNKNQVILKRNDWLAALNTSYEFLQTPVSDIIILESLHSFHLCYSFVHCSYKVREIQEFFMNRGFDDIPYNFLTTQSGYIFEGRGYQNLGAHTLGYNHMSYGISFLGNFSKLLPRPLVVENFLKFVSEMLLNGWVNQHYNIFAHIDLGHHGCTVEFSYLIHNWQKNKQLNSKAVQRKIFSVCNQRKKFLLEITLYPTIALIFFIVLTVSSHYLKRYIKHSKICRQLMNKFVFQNGQKVSICIISALNSCSQMEIDALWASLFKFNVQFSQKNYANNRLVETYFISKLDKENADNISPNNSCSCCFRIHCLWLKWQHNSTSNSTDPLLTQAFRLIKCQDKILIMLYIETLFGKKLVLFLHGKCIEIAEILTDLYNKSCICDYKHLSIVRFQFFKLQQEKAPIYSSQNSYFPLTKMELSRCKTVVYKNYRGLVYSDFKKKEYDFLLNCNGIVL